MFFRKKKDRAVSVKKMKAWLDKQELEKVAELLQTGDVETRMNAVKFLSTINMANVKRELVKALQDPVEGVALLVAEKLEYMGVTPDERAEIEKYRKHWKVGKKSSAKKNTEGFLLGDSE